MAGNTDRGIFGFGHKDEDKPQQHHQGTAPTQQGVGGYEAQHQQGGYGTGMRPGQQQPIKPEGYEQHGHGTQMPTTGGYAVTQQPGQSVDEEHKPGLKEKIGETLGINKLKKGHKKGEEDGSSSSSSDEEDNATGEKKKKHHLLG